MKLKDLLNENVLGQLPSSKLIKMKWNPVTEGNDDLPMDKMDSAEMEPFREDKLNELDIKMARVIDKRDKLNFADSVEGYVHTFAKNGFNESDIQKYLSELVTTYVRSNYRKASR